MVKMEILMKDLKDKNCFHGLDWFGLVFKQRYATIM